MSWVQWIQSYMHDPVFISRWATRHVVIESIVFVISLYVATVVQMAGWLILSSILSVIGGSIPLCCCPTVFGWRSNVMLQSIAAFINSFLFFATIILLSHSHRATQTHGALVLLWSVIISLCSIFPFIVMSRWMSTNYNTLGAITPQQPQIVAHREHPTMVDPNTGYALAPAVVVVYPHDQQFHQQQQPGNLRIVNSMSQSANAKHGTQVSIPMAMPINDGYSSYSIVPDESVSASHGESRIVMR